MCQFWELSQQYEISTLLDQLIESKDQYLEIKKLKQENSSDVYEYHLVHEFSIYNPVFKKRLDLRELVTLDNNFKYKNSETLNDFADMMMQVLAK